ncbi:MAG: YggS family pyridoxal phosphate-dependent enzyme [Alphaproteobacteria bacterium]|nr:YggS family pyridoxal phosphate-dependent enzyme [Alphaproteobacteria bacterium]
MPSPRAPAFVPGDDVAANLAHVRRRIAAAAAGVGRRPSDVALVAVSKNQPAVRVAAALQDGQRAFGENQVQEAQAKWPALRARFPDITLHLLGPLQTNKVKAAVATFDVIQTLDRPKLAHALAAELAASGKRPPCFIEVNIGEEPQKAGVLPAELPQFLELCQAELNLPVVGLMCIPPLGEIPAPHFALLAKLADRHRLAERSMGMSGDYEDAVTLGATIVRVGTAIFGERAPKAG